MLAFLHTASVHVPTFDALAQALGADVPVRHHVREDLFDSALAAGSVTAAIRSAVHADVRMLVAEGARLVVCTCSTLGDSAESTPLTRPVRVLRIDRPMAEYASSSGKPLLVVAATPSALSTAVNLLSEIRGSSSQVVRELSCADAWPFFRRGDRERYVALVAERIAAKAERGELVILAQASMADARASIQRDDIEVITSPDIGVRAAVALYRAAVAADRQ